MIVTKRAYEPVAASESAHHPWRSPARTTRFNRIHSVGPMHTYLLRVNAFPEWTTIAGSPG